MAQSELEQAQAKKIAELKRQLEIAEYRLEQILNESDDPEEM